MRAIYSRTHPFTPFLYRSLSFSRNLLAHTRSQISLTHAASNGQQHYYMALPKAPLWAVVVFCLAALSVFLHVVQGTRHARALRILKEKVGKGLQERDGGNRQTTELFRLAEERYIQLKQEGARAEGAAPTPGTVVNANTKKAEKKLMKGQVKREAMLEDPDFRRIVDDLIGSIKIEVRVRVRGRGVVMGHSFSSSRRCSRCLGLYLSAPLCGHAPVCPHLTFLSLHPPSLLSRLSSPHRATTPSPR